MPAILQIEVSEEMLDRLRRQGEKVAKAPEMLAAEYVAAQVQFYDNPLLKWAGAVSSNVPDASVRHHEYLGQALYDELQEPVGDHDVR